VPSSEPIAQYGARGREKPVRLTPKRLRKLGTPRSQRYGAAVRYGTRRKACFGYAAGLILGAAAVLGLAYGVSAPPKPTTVGMSMLATVTKPGVAATLAIVLVLWVGWCVRSLRFEFLAWWPGHIEVVELEPPANAPYVDVAWLSSVFRARVTQLSLQAPAPVPGAATEGAYLDVLSGVSVEAGNPLSLLRMGRAMWPTHAYRIEATLRTGAGDSAPCTVLAQVNRLPHVSSTLVWGHGSSWEDAVREAADEATAIVLPRTRLCQGQWLTWRGYVMPRGLLPAYERAVRNEADGDAARRSAKPFGTVGSNGKHEQARRCYEAAQRGYKEVLDEDPFNLTVRLRVGQLHEKVGQHLEALAAYHGIVTVTRPAGEKLPRKLYPARTRWERKRVITIARYRRAVLLGGDQVADDWSKASDELRRDLGMLLLEEMYAHAGALVWERERTGPGPPRRQLGAPRYESGFTLQELLEELLEARATGEQRTYFGETAIGAAEGVPPYIALRRLLCERPTTEDGRLASVRDRELLRALFASLSSATAQELRYERGLRLRMLRGRALRRLRPSRVPSAPPFTIKALRLSQLCIRLRLARALSELGVPGSSWEHERAAVKTRVEQVIGGSVRQWHEGYNAACACGIPLLFDGAERARPKRIPSELAETAVMWLERATACADSGYVAGENDWLQHDPDLEAVREDPAYLVWRSVYFPAERETEPLAPQRFRTYARVPPT
jgi:hypothetical protein